MSLCKVGPFFSGEDLPRFRKEDGHGGDDGFLTFTAAKREASSVSFLTFFGTKGRQLEGLSELWRSEEGAEKHGTPFLQGKARLSKQARIFS